jgi:hypothetical protein
MLMIRSAHERRGADRRPTLRSVGRGITIGAVLVAFSAFAEEIHTGIAPPHSVQAPASPALPTPPTVPTAPTALPPVAIGDSATKLNSQLDSTNAALGHLGSRTSDAADAACRGKGFGSGRSLDTQSAQNCPPGVWLSGRLPATGDCPLETFVTRAICQ